MHDRFAPTKHVPALQRLPDFNSFINNVNYLYMSSPIVFLIGAVLGFKFLSSLPGFRIYTVMLHKAWTRLLDYSVLFVLVAVNLALT